MLHSTVAGEEAFVDVDSRKSVEVVTGTLGFGRATGTLSFCTDVFRLLGGDFGDTYADDKQFINANNPVIDTSEVLNIVKSGRVRS